MYFIHTGNTRSVLQVANTNVFNTYTGNTGSETVFFLKTLKLR